MQLPKDIRDITKCEERYGREWSSEITATTVKSLKENGSGVLTHISGKPRCLYLDLTTVSTDDTEAFYHLVTAFCKDIHNLKRFVLMSAEEGVEFYTSYNSINEIIDDGWAIN